MPTQVIQFTTEEALKLVYLLKEKPMISAILEMDEDTQKTYFAAVENGWDIKLEVILHCISLKQPYADFMINGWTVKHAALYKTIETRTWHLPKKYFGKYLTICSSQTFHETFPIQDKGFKEQFKYGYALGLIKFNNSRDMTIEDEDKALCGIYPNAKSWIVEDKINLDPFQVKGSHKIYKKIIKFEDFKVSNEQK